MKPQTTNETQDNPVPQKPKNEVITINDPAKDRYNTFEFISWWKGKVVRNARVLVVGAGALGNEVLKNLALMGIGEILIIDFDTIDDANLSRSVLFRASDNGQPKAKVAARAVKEINSDVKVQWLNCDINNELGLGVYRRMHAVIGCLDNRLARLSINKACWKLNKPWVDGAIQELFGVARVFKPNDGACYECTLRDEDYRIIHQRTSCPDLARRNVFKGKVPTTPTISSIIGAVQAQEALKIIHGMEIKGGVAYTFNGLINDYFDIIYAIKEDCQSHETWDNIMDLLDSETESTSLGDMLAIVQKDLGDDARFLLPVFVSEAKCYQCNYKKSINKPKYQLYEDDAYCPHCGEMMKLENLYYIEKGVAEEMLRMTLSEAGFPKLAIIQAINAAWESRYYEISGDETKFLNFE